MIPALLAALISIFAQPQLGTICYEMDAAEYPGTIEYAVFLGNSDVKMHIEMFVTLDERSIEAYNTASGQYGEFALEPISCFMDDYGPVVTTTRTNVVTGNVDLLTYTHTATGMLVVLGTLDGDYAEPLRFEYAKEAELTY